MNTRTRKLVATLLLPLYILAACGGGGGSSEQKSDNGSNPPSSPPQTQVSLEQRLNDENLAAEQSVSSILTLGASFNNLFSIVEQEDFTGWNDYWNNQFPSQMAAALDDINNLQQKEQAVEEAVLPLGTKSITMAALAIGGIVLAVVAWIKSVKDNATRNVTIPSQETYDLVYKMMREQGHDDQAARAIASSWAVKAAFDVENGLGILGTIRDSTRDGLVAITEAGISEAVAPAEIGDALIRTVGTSGDEVYTLWTSPSSTCPVDNRSTTQATDPVPAYAEQIYIGRSQNGRLNAIPGGNWDVVLFVPGKARAGAGCVNIIPGETTEIDVDLIPVGKVTAEELVSGKRNISSADDYVVWYMDNVRCWGAPRVYATHRDAFNLEEDTCNIPGGGINCDIKVKKVELQGGFASLEEAQSWFCPKITTNWYHYWCNNRGARVEVGDGVLYTLQIPCDLSNVPYQYP